MDFYDLKGVLERLAEELHLEPLRFVPAEYESFHPGKCATVHSGEVKLGVIGEIHPLVRDQYNLLDAPLLAAEFRLDSLLEAAPGLFEIEPIPVQPPVLEDLAIVVNENIPAREVEDLIRQAGGSLLADLRLFDVYRGEQVGSEKKSLAYSLIYQNPERTLTDKEVASIRKSIVTRLEKELGASLRS